jgi:hypothetical protein
MRAATLLSGRMRKAGRQRMKDEGLWKSEWPAGQVGTLRSAGHGDARAYC